MDKQPGGDPDWWPQEVRRDQAAADQGADGLVAELRRSLSEETVTLLVSSKVIMLAQHWVENQNTADTVDTRVRI